MIFDSIALGSKQELLCNNLSNAKKCFFTSKEFQKECVLVGTFVPFKMHGGVKE
jgi:hypothetical protein